MKDAFMIFTAAANEVKALEYPGLQGMARMIQKNRTIIHDVHFFNFLRAAVFLNYSFFCSNNNMQQATIMYGLPIELVGIGAIRGIEDDAVDDATLIDVFNAFSNMHAFETGANYGTWKTMFNSFRNQFNFVELEYATRIMKTVFPNSQFADSLFTWAATAKQLYEQTNNKPSMANRAAFFPYFLLQWAYGNSTDRTTAPTDNDISTMMQFAKNQNRLGELAVILGISTPPTHGDELDNAIIAIQQGTGMKNASESFFGRFYDIDAELAQP